MAGIIDDILVIPFKTSAAQMAEVRKVGSKFLSHRYPSWKYDSKTYMIPPIFEAKGSKMLMGVSDTSSPSDIGDQGESMVYSLLRDFGNKKHMGMFVIHGFKLWKLSKWNTEHNSTPIPEKQKSTRECDFIIFHHSLGIIHLEVKNCVSNNAETIKKDIQDALEQLQIGKELIQGFVKPDLVHWSIIALPSTLKSAISDNTLQECNNVKFLLAEDVQNLQSFECWWAKTFETSHILAMSSIQHQAYEVALSYIVMVRHLTPMTESDYVVKLSTALNKYAYLEEAAHMHPENFKDEFHHIVCWYIKVTKVMTFQNLSAVPSIEGIKRKLQQKNDRPGLKAFNKHLEKHEYVCGTVPSVLDKEFADIIDSRHLLSIDNIVRFYNHMKHMHSQIKMAEGETEATEYFLDSVKNINKLEQRLGTATPFLQGKKPGQCDLEIFQQLVCNFNINNVHLQIVLTPDQLAIFEGPEKQLIIGGPGSGKTELLKAKAKQLAREIVASKRDERILYIIATGSPSGDPLLSYKMKEFFVKFPKVEVTSIIIEEESPELLQQCKLDIHEKLAEKNADGKPKYTHVFIDEYWIGCKPAEHEIIVTLVQKIPKYVWISSVFDYHPEKILTNERMVKCTGPLLQAFKEAGGVVSHINQIVRGTNSIIKLERGYSALYQGRSYPYGTEKMFGHSIEGFRVKWKHASDVDIMYSKCVKTIKKSIQQATIPEAGVKINRLSLSVADILVVDFAVRSKISLGITSTLMEQLVASGIPVWSFGEKREHFMNRKQPKLTLLSSKTREESTYLDGMEWPMVIVILPLGVLLNKDSIVHGAESLRNYDTYIAFFRAQVKLVVISDKWKTQEQFLEDIALKIK